MPATDKILDAQIALLRRAIESRQDDLSLAYDLAELLIRDNQIEEGVAQYRRAFEIEPQLRPASIATPVEEHARVAPATAAIADALIASGMKVSAVLLARAWSAAILGDREGVATLVDTDRFLHIAHHALPDLLTPAFQKELVAEVVRGMTEHRLPWSAIKQAQRNSHVLDEASSCGSMVASGLRHVIDGYIAALQPACHPFVSARPDRYRLEGWCVAFDGASRHISHIHPNAWLSGVLYLQTEGIDPEDSRRRGWLRVGSPEGISPESDWPEIWIAPEPATLVLFPSYFTHETIPLESNDSRLCIAFDVVKIC